MSPKGFEGIRNASAEVESRRAGSGPSALWFRLRAGEEAIVRFLEQDDDVAWAMMHEVPVEGRQFGRNVVCLDQEKDGTPCPGCDRDLPRKFRGFINLIWNEAPVFKRDTEGKMVKDTQDDPVVIDHKPQVAVWSSGIRLFEELDEHNANYRGLRSRPFRVKRKGEGLKTTYTIAPADVDGGPVRFTEQEKALEKDKYDLNLFTKPGTHDEFLKELGEAPQNNGNKPESQVRVNPFMRKAKRRNP